jgi:hypothetical protein
LRPTCFAQQQEPATAAAVPVDMTQPGSQIGIANEISKPMTGNITMGKQIVLVISGFANVPDTNVLIVRTCHSQIQA